MPGGTGQIQGLKGPQARGSITTRKTKASVAVVGGNQQRGQLGRPRTQARVFVLTQHDAETTPVVVTDKELRPLDCSMVVATPTRKSLLVENVYRDSKVIVGVLMRFQNSAFFNKLGWFFGETLVVEENTAMKRRVDRGRIMERRDDEDSRPIVGCVDGDNMWTVVGSQQHLGGKAGKRKPLAQNTHKEGKNSVAVKEVSVNHCLSRMNKVKDKELTNESRDGIIGKAIWSRKQKHKPFRFFSGNAKLRCRKLQYTGTFSALIITSCISTSPSAWTFTCRINSSNAWHWHSSVQPFHFRTAHRVVRYSERRSCYVKPAGPRVFALNFFSATLPGILVCGLVNLNGGDGGLASVGVGGCQEKNGSSQDSGYGCVSCHCSCGEKKRG
ncbi:hypothetical protein LWI28_010847 [Acer negundo]|uniref:Uncharacterized protein n=1 Tax=Acer negundo TaxID=4023 RepID=A0AAD5NX02_ACENE|nr:hypothetical protein LWI28_010847 [Acer negundo]